MRRREEPAMGAVISGIEVNEPPLVLKTGGWPLLDRVYTLLHNKDIENIPIAQSNSGGSGIESGLEIERRYLPKRLLKESEILAIGGSYARSIEQKYVEVYKDETGDEERKETFRLRKTKILHTEQGSTERDLWRVAIKKHVKGSEYARKEVQEKIAQADTSQHAKDSRREFERLWNKGIDETCRTRYYIPRSFRNKNGEIRRCEIHYEINHTPPSVQDFVRIEVEFDSEHDAAFAEEHPELVLPDWIGQDVTDDKRYKSKRLLKNGVPDEGEKLMQKLYSTNRAKY